MEPRTSFSRLSILLSMTSPLQTNGSRSKNTVIRSSQSLTSKGQNSPKKKTGVFIGAYATNPVNLEKASNLDRGLRAGELRHGRNYGRASA
jgi:hypothetical protein